MSDDTLPPPAKMKPGKLRDNNAIIAAKVAELLRSPPAEPTPPPPAWIGIDEAAKLLHVSRATLDRAIGELPASRRPGRVPSRGKGERVRYGWAGEEALRQWWTDATRPATAKPAVPKKRRHPSPMDMEPVDWAKVKAELRGRQR